MDMLDIYTDYLICQNKYATATGLSDMLDGEFSHDKVTRFLRLGDFDSKMLWKYIKPAIREHETEKKGSRYLVKDSGTSQSPKSTRQRAKLRAATVLRPLTFALNEQSVYLPQ